MYEALRIFREGGRAPFCPFPPPPFFPSKKKLHQFLIDDPEFSPREMEESEEGEITGSYGKSRIQQLLQGEKARSYHEVAMVSHKL